MTSYVAGFLFDPLMERVALILKNHPEWQKGKLNAIGGHIEPGELPLAAMEREFLEETGVKVTGWKQFVTLVGEGFVVFFFYVLDEAAISDVALHSHTPTTDEKVFVHGVDLVKTLPTVPNLLWLIEAAKSMIGERASSFVVCEAYE